VDLAALVGSGPGGRITGGDVLAAADGAGTVLPFGKMRKRIAERLSLSARSIPHFYLSMDVDVTDAQAWRRSFNDERSEHVTVTDLLIRAAALALREFERLNAHGEDDRLIVRKEVNVGVAVAVEDGLLVPVVPEADKKTLIELSRLSKQNAEAARRGVMRSAAVGTFTVSSLGMDGVGWFLPLINPPECAILAAGAVQHRVVPVGADVAVREIMTLTLGCDHRAVDGRYAAAFLNRVGELLRSPGALLGEPVEERS
jgi:pyruvate dehydrogenase E2 component (dihydrolipoamide acetyltransferase)